MPKKIILIILAISAAFATGYLISRQNGDKPESSVAQTSNNTSNSSIDTKILDLSGQGLTALPDSVLSRTDVTHLNLSNNQLTSLPAEIGKLTNLKSLNVENNRLISLPPEIGQLTNLEEADFGNNRLENLPVELGNLTQLKTLNLSGYNSSADDFKEIKSKLTNTQVKS